MHFKRQSLRLKNYNYASKGLYFITLCTYARTHLFGKVTNNRMSLSAIGEITHAALLSSSEMRNEINLVSSVIMPNHLHAIVEIDVTGMGRLGDAPPQMLDRLPVGAFVDSGEGRSPNAPTKMWDRLPVGAFGECPQVSTNPPISECPQISTGPDRYKKTEFKGVPSKSLGSFVGGFKSTVTSQVRKIDGCAQMRVWQKNYWDRIIRNEEEFSQIGHYIESNPENWRYDRFCN